MTFKHLVRGALTAALVCVATGVEAQKVEWFCTTDGCPMARRSIRLEAAAREEPLCREVPGTAATVFGAWGTTFNEQDWRALSLLPLDVRDSLIGRVFAPDGDLRFSRGRVSMNANDYALSWYSCDEVDGDFSLRHFNIEHDRLSVLPYIHAAMRVRGDLRLWMSPWSPPSWMKINHHYAVQSSRFSDLDPRLDALLYGDDDRSVNEQVNPDKHLFPRRLAVQDFMIQDPRYLQAYADMFCRFIELYKAEGVTIDMVMYQNEAYSYTPYPGCPWTAAGIRRFNLDYLGPTLRARHPEVSLFLGTINTNRYDHVHDILTADPRMTETVAGMGFQWEGGQILPRIRKEHPELRYISSESECGNGAMDWAAGEHTFALINHYVGNGCSEYYNWNAFLTPRGESAWGWRQNALVEIDDVSRTYRLTPEYYAYMHYSHFIGPASRILASREAGGEGTPALIARCPDGRTVAVCANLSDTPRDITLGAGKRFLNVRLEPHSFHTFRW